MYILLLSFFFGEPSATRILLWNSYGSRTCTFFRKLDFYEKQFQTLSKYRSVCTSFCFDFHNICSIDYCIDYCIVSLMIVAPKRNQKVSQESIRLASFKFLNNTNQWTDLTCLYICHITPTSDL